MAGVARSRISWWQEKAFLNAHALVLGRHEPGQAIGKADRPVLSHRPWRGSGSSPPSQAPALGAVSSSPAASMQWPQGHRPRGEWGRGPHAPYRCAVLDPGSVVKNRMSGYT